MAMALRAVRPFFTNRVWGLLIKKSTASDLQIMYRSRQIGNLKEIAACRHLSDGGHEDFAVVAADVFAGFVDHAFGVQNRRLAGRIIPRQQAVHAV